MRILVLNAGSSSLKFQVIACASGSEERLASGILDGLGTQLSARYSLAGQPKQEQLLPAADWNAAVSWLSAWLDEQSDSLGKIEAVGHRVVHGGEHFRDAVRIDAEVREGIAACAQWAPLHNAAALAGIASVEDVLGSEIPQFAVFDTAFHGTLPPSAYRYAIPGRFYEQHRIRRYGFHGTSHRYLAERYRQMRSLTAQDCNVITLHLGNGCSAAAIRQGKSIETSMGMTPLEGLVMGTRSGDLDPALLEYIAGKEGVSVEQATLILNRESGLLGLSGYSNDMRKLLADAAVHPNAALALNVFCHRVRKYIGAYLAVLEGADALVFGGGIGENAAAVRSRICEGFAWAGLTLDETANQAAVSKEAEISQAGSTLRAYVIPTDEERLIARDCYHLLSANKATSSL
jgi:acetate kinase